MIEACIFDLDGTLVNSLTDLAISTNYALKQCGFNVHPEDAYKYFIGSGAKKLIERALPETARDEETVNNVLDIYNEYYKKHSMDEAKPYEGIIDMLKKLNENNIKICVLSNKPDNFTQDFINFLFSEIKFEIAMGKMEQFEIKPNPAAINYIIDKLNVSKKECIYIGDSDVDVVTAHNADIKCIGVSWGFRGRNELEKVGSDYIVDVPEEILDILNVL